jgi:small subunit ribosomal protein S20
LANTKQAAKRARQAIKHRAHNMSARSKMRTQLKRAIKSIASGDVTKARTDYRDAASSVDSMVNKKLVHRNNAARHKSRLNARLKTVAGASKA